MAALWPDQRGGRAHQGDQLARRVGQRDLDLRAGLPIRRGGLEQAGQGHGQVADRLPQKGLGRDSGQALGRAIEERDTAPRPHRDHPALDRGEDALDVLVHEQHLMVNLRVAHRDRGLVREGCEQIGIVTEEGIAGPLRPDCEETDHPIAVDQRRQHFAPQPREAFQHDGGLRASRLPPDLVEEEEAPFALQLYEEGQRRRDRLRELAMAQEVGALEPALLLVEQVDRQPFRPQRRAHRAREVTEEGGQVDRGAQRATRLPDRPLVVVGLAIEVAIERALDLPLERGEEYRHEKREEDLSYWRLVLIVEERVRDHQQHQQREAGNEDRREIHYPAADLYANVHQPMTDDRVADHRDHDEGDIWTKFAKDRAFEEQGD